MSLEVLERLPLLELADVAKIKSFYEQHGVVLVRMLDASRCNQLVLEQWKRIILKQPWSETYRIGLHDDTKRKLQIGVDDEEILAQVKGPLNGTVLKKFEAGWPFHRGFGACSDPVAFHLPGVWALRQDPALYKLASALCENKELWVDINRSIQKLPGQGDNEFLHWDLNPFSPASGIVDGQRPKNICGKVCYTRSRFVAVCGTHTPEFHARFASLYRQHYPDVKPNAPKFGLDCKKPDPLGLVAARREYEVPAGCMVIWSDKLLHGQVKTPKNDPVEYGCYIGFFPAGSRAEYQRTCGVDEREDRLASYREGRAPILWPSFDRIQFYPKKFQNFPKLLQAYIDKMPKNHPSITTRVTGNGSSVPHLTPWKDEDYVPPELTLLGKRLLGLEQWPGQEGKDQEMQQGEKAGNSSTESKKRSRQDSVGKGQKKKTARVAGEGGNGDGGNACGEGSSDRRGHMVDNHSEKSQQPHGGDVGASSARDVGKHIGMDGMDEDGVHACKYNALHDEHNKQAVKQSHTSRGGTCLREKHAGENTAGNKAHAPHQELKVLLVTKKQEGHGLRQDMRVYEDELQRRHVQVRCMELMRHTAGALSKMQGDDGARKLDSLDEEGGNDEQEKGGAQAEKAATQRDAQRLAEAEAKGGKAKAKACRVSQEERDRLAQDETFASNLTWCNVIIGFEFLGDSRTWSAILKLRRAREHTSSPLVVALVPNLEYTKRSNEASCDTMQNLTSVDVIVAKTEGVYAMLHDLFLERTFANGCGNLMLVPHTTLTELPPILNKDAAVRDCIIHFPGSSKNKNTSANCEAALRLIKRYPDVIKKLIIKCSHSQVAAKRPKAGHSKAIKSNSEERGRKQETTTAADDEEEDEEREGDSDASDCKVCCINKLREMVPGVEIELINRPLSEPEKAQLYSRCRLAMCASRCEGFGHYILEAAAYGCQVVTTNGIPMRNVLHHQVSLARPSHSHEKCRNLGVEYIVNAASVEEAGIRLVEQTYDPMRCRANLEERIGIFREHFAHLLCALRSSGVNDDSADAAAVRKCRVKEHWGNATMFAGRACTQCKRTLHGELRVVNAQAPDKVVWVCEVCGDVAEAGKKNTSDKT